MMVTIPFYTKRRNWKKASIPRNRKIGPLPINISTKKNTPSNNNRISIITAVHTSTISNTLITIMATRILIGAVIRARSMEMVGNTSNSGMIKVNHITAITKAAKVEESLALKEGNVAVMAIIITKDHSIHNKTHTINVEEANGAEAVTKGIRDLIITITIREEVVLEIITTHRHIRQ